MSKGIPQSDFIQVGKDETAVFAYNPKSMKKQEIGTVVVRKFQGEGTARPWFMPADGSEPISLKATGDQVKVIDYTRVLDPLLEKGFRIAKQTIFHDGLSMEAILEAPEDQKIEDPITWDKDLWSTRPTKPGEVGWISRSVRANVSLKAGFNANLMEGLYRWACTNGLMHTILNYANLRMNWRNWDPTRIHNTFNRSQINTSMIKGEFIGTASGAAKTAQRINEWVLTEDEHVQIPAFIRKQTDVLSGLPGWYLERLSDGLLYLAKGAMEYQKGNVFALDIINAVTNPTSIAAVDDPFINTSRMLSRHDAVVTTLVNMVGVFSLS
jgi:hypothetical protein